MYFLKLISFFIFITFLATNYSVAEDSNEFKIKRENNFNFHVKPTIEKAGEGFNIFFEVKSYCDATIVIEEESSGKIVRHLISGVLGANAPEPLQKNSKVQKVYFDGKNDAGEYLKDFASVKVRVSLGLSPLFEKTLFDFPKRRHSVERQLLYPTEEGVVVYDGGNNIDFVKLYSHTGDYIRTIYPFPADKIKDVKGLKWKDLPEGGGQFPVKSNFLQTSFLESGSNFAMDGKIGTNYGTQHYGMYGKAASFLTAGKNTVAFGIGYLARLNLDGSSGGMDFNGPAIGHKITTPKGDLLVQPASAVISNDGKKIYFTGYHNCVYFSPAINFLWAQDWTSYHHVYEMDINSNEPPKLFLGDPLKSGDDEKNFNMPVHMCTDENNRLYICDYLNSRIQVFDENKKLLKSVKMDSPAFITVLPKSKEVVVVSYVVPNKVFAKNPTPKVSISYYNLGTFENMKVGKPIVFPEAYDQVFSTDFKWYNGSGFPFGICISDVSGDIKIWISKERGLENIRNSARVPTTNIKIWKIVGEKLEIFRDFEEEIKKDLFDSKPLSYSRQLLQVNPVTGDLYVGKTLYEFNGKSFKSLYKINPTSGKISNVDLAFEAEDYCFDNNGFLYIKFQDIISRYNSETLKEVPWDYGIEVKTGEVISALRVPTYSGWHQGGIFVNVKGNIVIAGPYHVPENDPYRKYVPEMYPGRLPLNNSYSLIHLYDKFGTLVKNDVVPSLKDNYGIGLDQYNNIYLMNSVTRVINGKPYSNKMTGTIMKFPLEGGKLISRGDSPIPLPVANEPKRPFDVGDLWAENSKWFFGGVGFMGKNTGVGCACWNSRMTFDYLNRTYAPELERYSVAVLDSNGNLITRIGKYGNRDSMGPKSLKPVGGDEVTMIHGAYLATMSDRFLYIADIANDRIISVKLNYAINELMALPTK